MAFAAAGFFENLLGWSVEVAEVVGQEDSGEECRRAGATAHAKGYLIVQLKVETAERGCRRWPGRPCRW